MHLDIRPLRTVGWVFGECHHNLALKQSACGIGIPHGLGISGPPVSVHTCNTPPRPPSHPSQQQAEPWSHHFSTCPTWWRAGLLSGWSWEVEGQCQCPPTPGGGEVQGGWGWERAPWTPPHSSIQVPGLPAGDMFHGHCSLALQASSWHLL